MPIKSEFQKLEKEDPEFYQFLLKNDKDLIESDVSEESDIESDFELEQEKEKDLDYHMNNLSKNNIKYVTRILKKSFEDGDFNLESTESFEKLTVCVFNDVVAFVKKELNLTESFKKYSNEPNYLKYKNAIRNIISCFIHFLSTQASDSALEDDHVVENPLMSSVLSQSSSIIQLAYAFPRTLKKIIIASCTIFGSSRSVLMKAKGLAVIKLAVHAKSGRILFNNNKSVDKSMLETAIKVIYKTYLQHSRQVHERNIALIEFMRQSIVSELCGIELETTYLLGYQYLRQVATSTRLAYDNKSEKKVNNVYGWTCLQSMRLWGLFISKYAIPNSNLLNAIRSMNDNKVISSKTGNHANLLIYPFVQLSHAILQLQPIPKFYPFTFHLTNVMIEINKSTGTMVPVMQYLLAIVQSSAVSGDLKNPTIKNIDFPTTVRASKMHINTLSYQQSLIEQCHDSFVKAIAVHSDKIYFCDWSVSVHKIMKTLEKNSANKKLKGMMHQICSKIAESREYLLNQRKNVKFGPCDLDLIIDWENNLPKQAPIAVLQKSIEKVEERMTDQPQLKNIDIVLQADEDKVEQLILSDDESQIKKKRKKKEYGNKNKKRKSNK
eukprot:NODE_279_length_11907_cov_0.265244.p2 type:complete len:608 gc:universal NODE_279_length_11907_cov_0.265244:3764-1941(-)